MYMEGVECACTGRGCLYNYGRGGVCMHGEREVVCIWKGEDVCIRKGWSVCARGEGRCVYIGRVSVRGEVGCEGV